MCEKYNSLLPEFFNDQQAIGFSQIVPCFFVVARTTVEKLRSYPPGQILVQEIILPCIRICNQLIIGYNKIQTHLIHCPKPTSDSKYFMSKSLHPVVSATHQMCIGIWLTKKCWECLLLKRYFILYKIVLIQPIFRKPYQTELTSAQNPRSMYTLGFWRSSGLEPNLGTLSAA